LKTEAHTVNLDISRTTETPPSTWRFQKCQILKFECMARSQLSLVRITKRVLSKGKP